MDISAALAADLAGLSRLLDEPGVDLEAQLRALNADLSLAVASYVAMTVTVGVDGHRVGFTVARDNDGNDARPAASLLVPLSSTAEGEADAALLLYATTAGAFVDLSADVSHALGLELSDLVLDAHLDEFEIRSSAAGMTGLEALAIVNQALGVLLERGHTPDEARAELQRLADLDGGSTREAAERIVTDLRQS